MGRGLDKMSNGALEGRGGISEDGMGWEQTNGIHSGFVSSSHPISLVVTKVNVYFPLPHPYHVLMQARPLCKHASILPGHLVCT